MRKQVRFLMFVVGAYYFLQAMGGNPGLHVQSLQKLLKETWHLSPTKAAAFFAFLNIPWMIKPLYGIISDFIPIFNSRRKNYFIITGILAAISYAFASWLNISDQTLSFLLFAAAVGIAFSDVLCDAIMVEKGKPFNITDRLQSAQWFALGFAGILIAFSKGYVAEYLEFTSAIRLSMMAPLLMVLFTIFALKEERVSSSKEALTQAYVGLKEALRSRTIWAATAFIFLFQFSPSLGSVLYYYEKDTMLMSISNGGIQLGNIMGGALYERIGYSWLVAISAVFTAAMWFFLPLVKKMPEPDSDFPKDLL